MAEIIVNLLAIVGVFSLLGDAFIILALWAASNHKGKHDPMLDKLIELDEQKHKTKQGQMLRTQNNCPHCGTDLSTAKREMFIQRVKCTCCGNAFWVGGTSDDGQPMGGAN